MSSKFRKLLKVLPNFFMVLGAVSVAFAMLLSMVNLPVQAGDTKDGVINWDGNGSDKLPCENGAQWNLAPGSSINSAILTVNGKNYAMSLSGAVWKAVSAGYIDNSVNAYATYTGELDNGTKLTISHCVGGLATTDIPTPTEVSTATPTDVTTATPTEVSTATPTEVSTATPTEVSTATPTEVSTATPTEVSTATPTKEATPGDPDPTITPDPTETSTSTDTPESTATPEDPDTSPTPPADETPQPQREPTLPIPVTGVTPQVIIPVTGSVIDFGSPLEAVQKLMFNFGLGFLGIGLVLQAIQKRRIL